MPVQNIRRYARMTARYRSWWPSFRSRQGGWGERFRHAVLLPGFCGGTGVASEPGTRPDLRSGRRRCRLSCYRLVGRVPVPGTHRRCRSDLPGLGRGRGSRVRRPAGACHPFNHRKGTAMTIVEDRPVITGGVDTHADSHVAAALDPVGGLLGVQEFPVTATGYASCWAGWAGSGRCRPGRDRGHR